jgi:hypothetical protein
VPSGNNTVSRVRANDGKLLETWTGATNAWAVLGDGTRFVTGQTSPGQLYQIDPTQPAGAVTTLPAPSGTHALSPLTARASDDEHPTSGFRSIVTPGATIRTVTTVVRVNSPQGILYDGANIGSRTPEGTLVARLLGAVLQTVTVGTNPTFPTFDGANIWVPNGNAPRFGRPRVERGGPPGVTGNGLNAPEAAAFDGRASWSRISPAPALSLEGGGPVDHRHLSTGTEALGACSDGVNLIT